MANYKRFESSTTAFVEQNIHNNSELLSYDAKYIINGIEKTSVLYFYQNSDNTRYYSLGLLESLDSPNIIVVANDLKDVFKFKTAKARRERIYNMIRENELKEFEMSKDISELK